MAARRRARGRGLGLALAARRDRDVGRAGGRAALGGSQLHLGSAYSHSMVPGGLLVMSSTTRFTSRSSLIIREAICSRRSYGNRAQSAVIASSLVTARMTMTLP